jgi:hypothetical protein
MIISEPEFTAIAAVSIHVRAYRVKMAGSPDRKAFTNPEGYAVRGQDIIRLHAHDAVGLFVPYARNKGGGIILEAGEIPFDQCSPFVCSDPAQGGIEMAPLDYEEVAALQAYFYLIAGGRYNENPAGFIPYKRFRKPKLPESA